MEIWTFNLEILVLLDFTKFNKFKKEIEGKKVLIVGLGLQGGGVGAVKFFHELKCKVSVTDLKPQEKLQNSLKSLEKLPVEKYTIGTHREEDFDAADILMINPDVRHDSDVYKWAGQKNKKVLMEEALFVDLCPIKVIGVTGTRGKTTTSFLCYELLKKEYLTIIAGNVSGSETLMNLFEIKKEDTKIILELSSFQLFGFHRQKISPHISLITNIYEDHLNRYKNMEEYVNDKRTIYLYQNHDDYLIISRDLNYKIKEEAKANIQFFDKTDVLDIPCFLKGAHNDENYAASLKVASIFKINDKNIKQVFAEFQGVPFRQEKVATINGVTFVNDTTASTPIAVVKALEAHPPRKIILLCGGNSKNCQTQEFARIVAERCKYVIFLKGDATASFRNEVLNFGINPDKLSEIFDDFGRAVATAFAKAAPGDVILLSPGFTSFAMFDNEFERGKQFNEIVAGL